MRKEILETYWHKVSIDENLQHNFCLSSWWWWKAREKDEEENNEDLEHDPTLDELVAEKIFLIYEDLSREDLLQRCLGGYTQNAHESLSSVIWKFAPKHVHSGLETVEIAAYIGVSIFDKGYTAI